MQIRDTSSVGLAYKKIAEKSHGFSLECTTQFTLGIENVEVLFLQKKIKMNNCLKKYKVVRNRVN